MHGSEEIMMGRSRKNNICILQDEMVSRTHAKLSVKGGKYYIQDLGSINGTAINATIMESHRDVRLRLSDEVEMGNSTFRVHVRDPLEVEEDTQVEVCVQRRPSGPTFACTFLFTCVEPHDYLPFYHFFP
jgi:pSer/pThr/pTyr-binding forkhead associated (FHA) protein